MDLAEFVKIQTRRSFFRSCAGGLETIALASLLEREGRAGTAVNPLAPKPPHFAAKATNVIFLSMAGAPSQMDLFDPKSAFSQYSGQTLPPSITTSLPLAFVTPTAAALST